MKRKNLIAIAVILGLLAVIDLPRLMSSCPYFSPPTSCGDPTTNALAPCYPHAGCTCAASGCHGGTALPSTSNILTLEIADSAVYDNTGTFETFNSAFKDTPGHTYLIGFLLNSNTGVYGFQMTALTSTNTMAGSFRISDSTHTYLQTSIASIEYIGHHNASSFLNWGYKWVAPTSCGPTTFYYAYNLSTQAFLDSSFDGGVGFPGGTIYTGSVTIQCAASGIEDISTKISNLEIFPNPTNNQFNLSFALKQSDAVSLNVYSSDGKVVQNLMQDEKREQGLFNSSFDISNLAPGIYLAKLSVGGASVTKKITKL